MNVYQKRLEKLRQRLADFSIEGLYVTHLPHVRYLTGFTGSAGVVLVLPDAAHFISDTRYAVQAPQQVENYTIHMMQGGYVPTIKNLELIKEGLKIGFEGSYLPFTYYQSLTQGLPNIRWHSTQNLVEQLSAVKDSEEIEALKEAVRITDDVFEDIQNDLKVGVVERDIAARVSYLFKTHGAEGDSYDPIVASGPNSALPHARPGDRSFKSGDFVVMDIGALYDGYHADMTRTIVIGEATDRHREIYDIVLKSQLAGIAFAKAGVTGEQLDTACRDVIVQAGYGKEFCHSTGHGIGLEVHTYPSVSRMHQEPLLANYVITIEPGIYIPDWGGVRIEDDCLLTEAGCEPLNRSTKELLVF